MIEKRLFEAFKKDIQQMKVDNFENLDIDINDAESIFSAIVLEQLTNQERLELLNKLKEEDRYFYALASIYLDFLSLQETGEYPPKLWQKVERAGKMRNNGKHHTMFYALRAKIKEYILRKSGGTYNEFASVAHDYEVLYSTTHEQMYGEKALSFYVEALEPKKASKLVYSLLKNNKTFSYQFYFDAVYTLSTIGDYEKVESLLSHAQKLMPTKMYAKLLLTYYTKKGELTDEEFSLLIKNYAYYVEDPNDIEVIGEMLMQRKMYKEAANQFARAYRSYRVYSTEESINKFFTSKAFARMVEAILLSGDRERASKVINDVINSKEELNLRLLDEIINKYELRIDLSNGK